MSLSGINIEPFDYGEIVLFKRLRLTKKTSSDCKILPATTDDLPHIVKMVNSLYRETNSLRHLSPSLSTKTLELMLSDGIEILVAKIYSDEPIAYICISETVSPQIGKYVIVNEIYVQETYRNLHIGSTLIENLKEKAKSRGWKQILVAGNSNNSSWYKIIHFYSSRFFKYSGPVLSYKII